MAARSAKTLDESSEAASDAALLDLAVRSGAKAVNVSLTSQSIVATAEEKEELGRKGSIVEMETTHVLRSAVERRVPCVAVRAISDAADEDLPVDFARILDSHGHLKMGGLLKEIGFSPYRIPLLLQFARQSRAAGKSLADFLDRYIPTISANWTKVAHPRIEEVSAT